MAIHLNPDYAEAYRYLGILHYNAEEWLPALEAFREAAEADPTESQYFVLCGEVETRLGNLQQAELDFQRAHELDQDLPLQGSN